MKNIIATLLVAMLSLGVSAQDKYNVSSTDKNLQKAEKAGWEVRLSAAYNLGGTAPLPLPCEIRAIEGFNPGLNLALAGNVQKNFTRHWALRWGVKLETKGMTTDADTKLYHMELKSDDSCIEGAFTGKVKTKVKNTYVTLPVVGVYNINARWSVNAGAYAACLIDGEFSGSAYDGYIREGGPTGTKTDVTNAGYDFSEELTNFNWGLQAGFEYRAYRHLAVFADLLWSMNGIFPSSFGGVTFALYPIYASLGFTYIF